MSVDLNIDGFDIEVRVSALDSLKRHESVVDSYLEDLRDSLEEKSIISDPVIVDRNSNVVLDGMHRLEAVSKLGYDKIPVCFVDYQSSRIKLGTWWRKFEDLGMDTLVGIAEDLGFEMEHSNSEKIEERIENRNLDLYFVSGDNLLKTKSVFDSIHTLFDSVHSLENEIVENSFDLSYEPDEEFLKSLESGDTWILFPPAEKREVVQVSDSGEVFPHKTTRHVVPARPLGIDFPLSWLDEELDEVNDNLEEKLKRMNLREVSPGSQFRGRKYKEKVVTFEKN